MFAHADDRHFEPVTKAHPGSHVVPAALAMAEREGRSGAELLAAVTLGYDVCCRFLLALGPDLVRGSHRSAEGTSSTMGAVAAAASLAKLDEKGMRHALSYAAQQVSGLWSWVRDPEHVEKAFDFSGMGARNGVTAAIMAQMEFTGVWDVLDGEQRGIAPSTDPKPGRWLPPRQPLCHRDRHQALLRRYPIQAPLMRFAARRGKASVTRRANCRQAPGGWRQIVNARSMDVNCQHIIALARRRRRFLRRQPLYERMRIRRCSPQKSACNSSPIEGSWIPPRRAAGS